MTAAPPHENSTTPPRRVVVAEDEALIRLDLVEMLREEGYDVVGEAGDGQRAVELADELKPDLVIMDVKMPRRDGIDAASEIAERRIAPVVILTAFSQRDLVERARDAGAMAIWSSRSRSRIWYPRSRWPPAASPKSGNSRRRSPGSANDSRSANSSTGPRVCSWRSTR